MKPYCTRKEFEEEWAEAVRTLQLAEEAKNKTHEEKAREYKETRQHEENNRRYMASVELFDGDWVAHTAYYKMYPFELYVYNPDDDDHNIKSSPPPLSPLKSIPCVDQAFVYHNTISQLKPC